ncbi:hypothetical protein [Streptomyces sp. NPDC002573]|uniref:hypothetical protein n=1 Tax=Streptomyces sp. NPDC002573 TaxID=3364651 RepID=UPI003693435A
MRAAVDLIMTVAVAAGAGVITAASDAARSVVCSVFPRPRETSVLVEVDGKRVELTGSAASTEAVQALIEQLRARPFQFAYDGRRFGTSLALDVATVRRAVVTCVPSLVVNSERTCLPIRA